ncbi:protein MEI2-like 2 [Cyclospora cayetanensis]|uniref:Protein MEI2-like 2 n=1 Tax=Cyclospora cayetanensis TaxID=88456 RepID=A0A6P6RS25_9EIME|nr:protein MEI2-like 2 [Cyclospora cayetanensis]
MTDPAYAAAIGTYPSYTTYPYAAATGASAPSAAAAGAGTAADYQWGPWGAAAARSSSAVVDPETEPDALQSRCLFFGRLAPEATEDLLRGLCEQYGDIRKITCYPEKHMAFVEFFDIRHAEAAREALRATDIAGKKADVQYSAIKRPDKDSNMGTLYIRPTNGVSASTTLSDPNSLDAYRRLFSSYGDIKKVSVNRKRDSEKFVEYHDVRDAAKALEALNGHNFNGVTLQICFAQNASRTFNREPTSRRVGAPRTPEGLSYGPYRGGYSPTSLRYVSPYTAPPVLAGAPTYGPYGVCAVQPGAAATYGSPYGYQQQQPPAAAAAAAPAAAAAAYPPSWPPAAAVGGPPVAVAGSPYGGPPRAHVPMAVYGGAPGALPGPWRPPQ